MENYTFIRDANAWASYKAMIDDGKEDSTFGRAYAYQHNGVPPEYPCLVRSHFWDDPNGPYNYDHSFMTKADAEALVELFKGPYYIYFYRGGRDPSEQLVIVDQVTFEKIWPHADDLLGAWYHEVPEDVLALVWPLLTLPDADLRDSEVEEIPDDHFIKVTLV